LLERGFIPSLVVTSPDAPAGRGLVLTPSPVKVLALEHNIEVLTPEKLDEETIASIISRNCDYAICVAYGKIFPESLIAAFPLGVLNVHYSLLPRHRGATPLEATLLAGDAEAGVTVQKMVKALDAGDVIAQESTPVDPYETARELRPRLVELGAELLADTLPAYLAGAVTPIKQDESLATHSGKFSKADGELDLSAPAEENWKKYRAYADSIGTYFMSARGGSASGGKNKEVRMKITSATFKDGAFVVERVIPEGKNEVAYVR
jgi:methionyl-tRNA formyltransferase